MNELLNKIVDKLNASVKTDAQSLTDAQKAQARTNVGAASEAAVKQLAEKIAAIGTQEDIVQQVIAALGTPVFGTVDENRLITLTGVLADGTYNFQYEDEDGNTYPLGSYTKAPKPTYTNILPLAINSDGSAYVGTNGEKGYKTGVRLNSNGAEATLADWGVTGFIPIDATSDSLYFKNIQWRGGSDIDNDYVGLYDASFSKLTSTKLITEWLGGGTNERVNQYGFEMDAENNVTKINFAKWCTAAFGSLSVASWPNVKYIRFSMYDITADSIITKNEPID